MVNNIPVNEPGNIGKLGRKMKSKHMNLIYPQWQGGHNISTYHGAKEFHELYLNDAPVTKVAVSTEETDKIVNGIFAYEDIVSQLKHVQGLIEQESPDTIFTVGGSCDACTPAISYLNHKLKGDMTVLWFDSHGDLNTPETSPSQNFHGMPLRTLLGDGDRDIVDMLPSKLTTSQAILLGPRDLDKDEQIYIEENDIKSVPVSDMELNPEAITDIIRSVGSANLYVHIDLDVLEPSQFPHVALPVPDGLSMGTLQKLLQMLNAEFTIVGLGLTEYSPADRKRFELLEHISGLGANLNK